MKKLLALVILICCITVTVLGQVGINTDNTPPDPSAMLDVKSPAKGLLPPRVNLTATNLAGPVTSPAIGLVVYNTATGGTSPYSVTPGIYCWDGTQWIPGYAPKGVNVGDMQYWNGVQWITIPAGLPGQFLQMSPSNIPSWAGSNFATIITNAATNITASSAMSGGVISSDGGSAITAKGICYNTSPNPTIANMKVTGGTGTGSFSSSMSGLLAGTTYYVRAYATNSAGTVYGNEISFTTIANATIPMVTTSAISNITAISAISGGTVNSAGGAIVTARGVCWSTSPNPTTANSKTSNGTGIGGFASTLSSLASNTTFYVRAYATNSAGTGYGNELTFSTLCANPVAASVSITTSANPVCAGSSVTFTATPTNGGSAPVYQWKVNGANVGSNGTIYTFTPVNNDVVTCVMTSNLACVTGNPATSNAITMMVNTSATAGVNIVSSANPVCAGNTVTFTATPLNGGTAPAYLWTVNGILVIGATSSTYSYIPLHNDAVTCQMTSNAPCVVGNPAFSNSLTMSVNALLPVSVTIIASSNPFISGSSVTFAATGVNGGTTTTYQWTVNGVNVGTNISTYSYTPENNDIVICTLTSNAVCVTGNPATSNTLYLEIAQMGIPCAEEPMVNYGGQIYNTVKIGNQCWFKENLNIGTIIYGQNQSNNSIIEKYCYNNAPSECDVYGGLYQWNEVMQYVYNPVTQGICPEGWHIPTDGEFCTLVHLLDPTADCGMPGYLGSVAGGKLKEVGNSHWFEPNLGATNVSGFSALPGGQGNGVYGTPFQVKQYSGHFWTSNINTITSPWVYSVHKDHENVSRESNDNLNGLSIRCIKNSCSTAPSILYQGTHVALPTQITWNWSPAANAIGYKWNTVNDFASGIEMGTLLSKTEFGLVCNSTFSRYVWAYNACGTSSPVVLTKSTASCPSNCGQPFTDTRDGKVYNTVYIGTQCWMKQNLNVGTTINMNTPQNDNGIIEKYCMDNNSANCTTYGGLYLWNEMMQYNNIPGTQGICPTNWHCPTSEEWSLLISVLGGSSAGGKLKETGFNHWESPNVAATNESGFTAFGAGFALGIVNQFKQSAYFMTSTSGANSDLWKVYLQSVGSGVSLSLSSQSVGFSIRCIMNE